MKVNKRMTGPSFANLILLKDPANTSEITLVKPTDLGGLSSSAPLAGRYIINCPDPSNPSVIAKTSELRFGDWAPKIEIVL